MEFCGPDQKRLAIGDFSHGLGVNLIELAPRPRVVQSWRTRTAAFLAASPDGRWVATGSYDGPGFQVWDTRRNVEAHRWDTGDADVAFSPDGRWLVSSIGGSAYSGAECVFWKVGTWERGPSIPLERTTSPSNLAFSDDGRMLVVARTMTELLLLDPRDLQRAGPLAAAGTDDRDPLAIQPGRRLPGWPGRASGFIHVWDLRRIRARLEDLGLDWDLPPLGPPPSVSASEPPLDVEVRLDPTLVDPAGE